MTYTSEDQDESKNALKSYKPLFEQTSIATKGVERVMNSEQGAIELKANQPPPAGTIPPEALLNRKDITGGSCSESGTGGTCGNIFPISSGGTGGGGTGGGTGSGGTGGGGGGTVGGGGNMPVADEQTVEADFDHYDRLRLWFKKYLGYKIKSGKDIFDKLRDNAYTINLVIEITALVSVVLLIVKKKIIFAVAAGLILLLKLVVPVVPKNK
jgi:hypothetical protein